MEIEEKIIMANVIDKQNGKNVFKISDGDFILTKYSGWGIVRYGENSRLHVHYFNTGNGWDFVDNLGFNDNISEDNYILKVVCGSKMTITLDY
jgi:hypothetical protein